MSRMRWRYGSMTATRFGTLSIRLFGACLLSALLLCGCTKGEMTMGATATSSASRLSVPELDKIRSMKILFGHQSVGSNLIDGLNEIAAAHPAARLQIVDMDTAAGMQGPWFAHFPVGTNRQPDAKIASFREHLAGAGNSIDVAFFKFCYVDAGKDSDVEGLFSRYRTAIAEARKQSPAVAVVHVTMPLTSIDNGWRGLLKRVRGRSTGEEDNAARTRFNNLMRKEYGGREPLFDLAAAESTAPDGSRVQGQIRGAAYEALCPRYTDDGGHLNRLGRDRCASALLQTLAQVSLPAKAGR